MCYDLKKYERAKIAKTDLHFFKVYRKRLHRARYIIGKSSSLISPHRNMVVEVGQTLPKVKIVKSKYPLVVIKEGYHCYVNKPKDGGLAFWKLFVVRVTIPKGTKYYSNDCEVVAEQITVNERVRN